jgi:hypothetical protein
VKFVKWNFFEGDDPLAPRMPEVAVGPNIAELFAQVRSMLPRDRRLGKVDAGEPWLGIVCPDRSYLLLTLPVAAEMPHELVEMNRACIPHTRPLHITAVSFTGLRPSSDIKSMPFIACILPLASIGHNIVVFEGHESGFEPALTDADVLVIDSGMLPFLQQDWFAVARRAFRDKGRIRMFDQKTKSLPPVVPSKAPRGWAYATEPDGEMSYVNALLTTLARRPPVSVQLGCGDARLPELPRLAVSPEEIEWTLALPFDYGSLNVGEVIRIICNAPGIRWSPAQQGQTSGTVRMKVAEGKGMAWDVSFQLLQLEGGPRGKSLTIERVE